MHIIFLKLSFSFSDSPVAINSQVTLLCGAMSSFSLPPPDIEWIRIFIEISFLF